MAQPITIKKRQMTIKKKPGPGKQPTASDGATPEGAESAEAGAESSTMFSPPVPTQANRAPTTATTVAAILALLSCLIFLFVLFLQWTEFTELNRIIPQAVPVSTISLTQLL